jgi:hypothetical protein
VPREGILTERVAAYRDSIDASTSKQIAELAGDRYERAAAAALIPG